ncbi:MAG: hypothetical protein QME83_09400 [Thermodesulfobacteriota bacterium]|nr:hypothetical protein [Thermodesulfobacteriota bacterium]
MTKTLENGRFFGYWDIGDCDLFGACLPAGRQGIWLLGFKEMEVLENR